MALIKVSTTYTRAFLMVQTSDHISGLTGASPTVNLSKAGGAFGAAGGAVTEIANGWYKVALNSTDTNTLGDLAYHITAASGDPTDFTDEIIGFDPTAAALTANVTQWNSANIATPNVSGVPKVDVIDWLGNGVAASSANGVPDINVITIAGGASNIKKNQALNNFMFVMTDSTNHTPKTGVTVSASRSIDGGAFASCANGVTEIANGAYKISLANTDLNGNNIMLRFTGASSDDQLIQITTQP